MSTSFQPVMLGGGGYNNNSRMQASALELGRPMLLAAARAVPLPKGLASHFQIAEFGCSEGVPHRQQRGRGEPRDVRPRGRVETRPVHT